MAFHPFHWFRKHQKVMFAVLTIVCMLTFVLCSGSGSPVFRNLTQGFTNAFGLQPGDKVTTLYGSQVTRRDMALLRDQRTLARNALAVAGALGSDQLDAERKKLSGKFDEDTFKKLQEFNEQQTQLRRAEWRGRVVFQNLGNLDNLLDFMVWRHQADQLGIQLTAADIEAEVKRWSAGRVNLADVEGHMQQNNRQGSTHDALVKALGDEFRVMLAQTALLGYTPEQSLPPIYRQALQLAPDPVNEVSAPVTPHEFLKFYRDQRTAVSVVLLPVPVSPPATGGALSDQDLVGMKALFERYKNEEPAPDRAAPGFKEPRRIRVEWVGVRPDAPAYRDKAKAVVPVLDAGMTLGPWTSAFDAGIGAALPGVVTHAAVPLLLDQRSLLQYDQLRRAGRLDLAAWTEPSYALSIYTNFARPETAAGIVAGALGAAGTQASPLAAAVSAQNVAYQPGAKDREALVAKEREERVPYGAGVVLSGLDPFEAAATWYRGAQTKQFLPPEAVKAEIADRVYEGLAKDLAVAQLRQFTDEFKKHNTRSQEAQDWLKTELPKFDFGKHEVMQEPADRYAIADAPALKPFKEAYLRQREKADPKADNFWQIFFQGTGTYKAEPWPPPFQDGELWEFADDPFLFWRVEDKEAYVPEFDAVKDKVEAAWRLVNARIRAEKEAAALAEEARKTGGDVPQLKDLAAAKGREFIEIGVITRQVPEKNAAGGFQKTYGPYKFPDSLRYPRKDWIDLLLGLKQKGDVTTLVNEPKTVFYVATLLDRTEPSVAQFYKAYQDSARSMDADPLRSELVQERQQKYREEVFKQLRIEAGAGADGKYQIEADVKKKYEGKDSGGEE